MRRYLYIISFAFIACNGNTSNTELTNTSDTVFLQTDTNSKSEVAIVNDLLSLDEKLFNEINTYDKKVIEALLLDGVTEENGWHEFEISKDEMFVSLFNNEFYETIEFRIMKRNNQEVGFLSLQTKITSSCIYLEKNEDGNWIKGEELPQPHLADFFEDISDEEAELINENGAYGIYLDNDSDTISYLFYDFQLYQNLPFEYQETFTKESKYDMLLKWDSSTFWLERIGYNN